jgi:8-oxo-dGTP pyrophosphatase MutT (NUDIX family)
MIATTRNDLERPRSGALSMASDPEGRFLLNGDTLRTQFGALCWRLRGGQSQVMLITSRDTGRWIIPKGWPIEGMTPEAAALREAWEEAGVEGEAAPACLGLYPYEKLLTAERRVPCLVAVYAVRVTRLRDRFPERKERRRAWFTPARAAERVEEEALRRLIAGFSPSGSANG